MITFSAEKTKTLTAISSIFVLKNNNSFSHQNNNNITLEQLKKAEGFLRLSPEIVASFSRFLESLRGERTGGDSRHNRPSVVIVWKHTKEFIGVQ